MDIFYITFPVSGVETWAFLPPLVAFRVSFFTSMGGVSGAFMLLPFRKSEKSEMSVLNYTSPSVSGTNQMFNTVAIPGSVYHYKKENRMVWPLPLAVIIGARVRMERLRDPKTLKLESVRSVLGGAVFMGSYDGFLKSRDEEGQAHGPPLPRDASRA